MNNLVSSTTVLIGGISLVLLLGVGIGFATRGSNSTGKVLTDNLSEPLNGATAAKVAINAGPGNLAIDKLTGGEQLLVSGTLQYTQNQSQPTRTLNSSNTQAILTLKRGDTGRTGFRFPWDACKGGAYDWSIHLNPTLPLDITAQSEGGNVKLDLAGLTVTHLLAENGGGNMDVVLPDEAANLNATVKTGAGNVTVSISGNVAARIHATSGLGKVIVDPQFTKLDANIYQSSDYDAAEKKIELTLSSGAGNVIVNTK
ncbi:MAG: toast rack family protein [Anaerolineaceae bacterium]|nr:toast rack family protein [Anaerolineaceae bacterium]